jgi:hypothetical protein
MLHYVVAYFSVWTRQGECRQNGLGCLPFDSTVVPCPSRSEVRFDVADGVMSYTVDVEN